MQVLESKVTCERILKLLLENGHVDKFRQLVDDLRGRVVDEMSEPLFFSLSDKEAEYYNNPWNGWKESIERFPDTIRDIEEAWKCFALPRYAAAVFHSLQMVEVGSYRIGQNYWCSRSPNGVERDNKQVEEHPCYKISRPYAIPAATHSIPGAD
jgi:hypothetical protein